MILPESDQEQVGIIDICHVSIRHAEENHFCNTAFQP